ncbi:hypothetical protein KL919_001770 [Ogataea angusta]|nr:hypothetical protein KL919_001770 [Ogataea angusta]
MLETIQNYEDRFNGRFHYDWVFLNDQPFDDTFKQEVANLVSGNSRFGQIDAHHWQFPSSLNRTLMEENIEKLLSDEDGVLPYADSVSYRHMCRFESGFFYRHPLLQEYKYFWRVEPGVKLYCDIDYDIFAHMHAHKYAYAFAISILEYPKSIPSLFRHVKDYLRLAGKEALLHDESNYARFVYDGDTDSYNLCHFWTNFELGDLDVFRSQEYTEMFEYLDRQNGFFYERWGDAPTQVFSVVLRDDPVESCSYVFSRVRAAKDDLPRVVLQAFEPENPHDFCPQLVSVACEQVDLVDHDEHAAAREPVLAQHPAELNKVLLEPVETGTVYDPHEEIRLLEIVEPKRAQRGLAPDVPDVYVEAGVRHCEDVEAHRGARFLDVLAQHALHDCGFAGVVQA